MVILTHLTKRTCLLQGKKIKKELVDLVKDLPTVYSRIGQSVANLKKASDYYSAFVEFTLKKYV